jgi:hypothetical protein
MTEPTVSTTSVPMPIDTLYREAATEVWCTDQLQIDHDATVSASDCGAWVHAWVWVSNGEAGVENQSDARCR